MKRLKKGRYRTVNSGAVTGKDFLPLPLILQIGVLLCYLNSPTIHALVIEGEAGSIDSEPIPVKIALELHQIVKINQREENFTGVVTLHLHYSDPVLAYEVKAGDPPFRQYHLDGFRKYVRKKGLLWPGVSAGAQGREHPGDNLDSRRRHALLRAFYRHLPGSQF